MSERVIRLGQGVLELEDFIAVARDGAKVEVGSWEALDECRAWLDEHLASWRSGEPAAPIYGVTTGFGSSKNVPLAPEDVEAAQVNLIRSHAIGVAAGGDAYFSTEVVRGAALLRAHTFLFGHSGVRRDLVELLVGMLNAGVHPRVPQRGSVGASGDLCPLSHFALVMIGEGEALMSREGDLAEIVSGAEALDEAGLEPVHLSYKEGLALINGTTFSTSTLALALQDAMVVARSADVACALAFEAMGGHARALDAKVHASRRQTGQQDAAAGLRSLVRGSLRMSATDDKQDVYSFRAAPVVHGASRDALAHVRAVVEAELDAVTDNPLMFALEGDDEPLDLQQYAENPRRHGREPEANRAYSAGNFHGQPVAVAADLLAIAVAEIASCSERRTAILVDPQSNRGLPAHLTSRPGLSSGFMLAQYTAASLVSENKVLAHPASVDSIPTGNGAEDHVSMSTWAARKARQVVELTARVLALELLVAGQANEWRCLLRDPSVTARAPTSEQDPNLPDRFAALEADAVLAELGEGSAAAHHELRRLSPRLVNDRSLGPDVERVCEALLAGRFVAVTGERTRPVRRSRFEPC
jgi:histidine ammonia-lyase